MTTEELDSERLLDMYHSALDEGVAATINWDSYDYGIIDFVEIDGTEFANDMIDEEWAGVRDDSDKMKEYRYA